MTRGERNNNPGNISYKAGFHGEIGLEVPPPGATYTARFGRYDTARKGIRAIAMQLLAYQNQHSLTTIQQFINRWAPASENPTSAYCSAVAKAAGVSPTETCNLKWPDTLIAVVRAIITQENGGCIYSPADISWACTDALVTSGVQL